MSDKFEYRIVVSDDDDDADESALNELGTDGWELVNAIADVRASDDEVTEGEDENVPVTVFYLKRRLS